MDPSRTSELFTALPQSRCPDILSWSPSNYTYRSLACPTPGTAKTGAHRSTNGYCTAWRWTKLDVNLIVFIDFLRSVEIGASFSPYSGWAYAHEKTLYYTCIYMRTYINYHAIHQPCRRNVSHCHFRKFTINLPNFRKVQYRHKNICTELKFG